MSFNKKEYEKKYYQLNKEKVLKGAKENYYLKRKLKIPFNYFIYDIGLKQCSRCKETKSLSSFTKFHYTSDGLVSQCRSCQKKDGDAWSNTENNRELKRNSSKVWKKANPEKVKKHKIDSYHRNKEHIKKKHKVYYRKYYEANKEEILLKNKKYFDENKEWRKQWVKSYDKTDNGRAIIARKNAKRRDRISNTINTLSKDEWRYILQIQGNKCAICNREFNNELKPCRDHIIPLIYGTSLTYYNTQALCKSCNSRKKDKIEGFIPLATDLKTLRKQLYSTPLDTRIIIFDAIEAVTHADTLLLSDSMIDLFSLRARGIIDLKLGSTISGPTVFETTPYCGPVLIPRPNHQNENENTGTGILYGSLPATTAYTELFSVTFSSDTAFSVVGSFSGSQGSGTTATTFTSTNLDLVIPYDAWSGTPANGDIFYIPIYKHIPEVVMLSAMLTAGLLIKGINVNTNVDSSGVGMQFYQDAINLLDAIAAGEAGLIGINTLINTKDLITSYQISLNGYDISNYDTYPENPQFYQDQNVAYNPFWFGNSYR